MTDTARPLEIHAHTKPSPECPLTFLCACETELYIPNDPPDEGGRNIICPRCPARWHKGSGPGLRRLQGLPDA